MIQSSEEPMWHIYTRVEQYWEHAEAFQCFSAAMRHVHTEMHSKRRVVISRIDVRCTKHLTDKVTYDAFGDIPSFIKNRKTLKEELAQIKLDRKRRLKYEYYRRMKLNRLNGLEEKGML